MGKGVENMPPSDDLELTKENLVIGAVQNEQKTEEIKESDVAVKEVVQDNYDNNERVLHIFGTMKTPWDDVTGKSEEGKAKNPNSYIVFWRMLIGFIFGLVFTAIFKLLVYLVVVHTPLVTFGYYSNSFSVLIVSTLMFYWFLYSLGKTSGPESVFRYSINFTAIIWLLCSIVSIFIFHNNNYDSNGSPLKWYNEINGKIVEIQKETNSLRDTLIVNTVTKDTLKQKYFIDCKTGHPCYPLTVAIREKMEGQSMVYAPISTSNPDNDTLLMPQNKAYRFILDSGQVTKVLTFPNGKLSIIWRSNLGKFVVWADTNGDGVINSNDESKAPDAAYTSFGTYKKVRVKFEGVARDTVYVLVTK